MHRTAIQRLSARGAALLLASTGLALLIGSAPAQAQNCKTYDNGQTICCDNNGNCYSR